MKILLPEFNTTLLIFKNYFEETTRQRSAVVERVSQRGWYGNGSSCTLNITVKCEKNRSWDPSACWGPTGHSETGCSWIKMAALFPFNLSVGISLAAEKQYSVCMYTTI